MNMRKNIFTILACAATAAMMFGCGSGAKKAAAEGPPGFNRGR